VENGEDNGETLKEGMRELGAHPETGERITVRRGPYGLYVQQGEQEAGRKAKPRRTSLPRGIDGQLITLEQGLALLSLPRVVGVHPETREEIEAGIGRFGAYVRMNGMYASLDQDDDVLSVGINRAVDVLARKLASVRRLGAHPADREPVVVRKGRFGPYAQHGKMIANLPRDVSMDEITLDQAVKLLAEKGKELKPRRARRPARGRAPTVPPAPTPARKPVAKAAAKKKPARRPAPKKRAAAKTRKSARKSAR
jgi:DNA topoisomerase-1